MMTLGDAFALAHGRNLRYGRFTLNRTAGTVPEPPSALAGEPFNACAQPDGEAMPTISVPVPHRPKRMFARVKAPEEKSPKVRTLLERAGTDCLPSLVADKQLKQLTAELNRLLKEHEPGVTDCLHEIDAHISRIVIDYLKRGGLRWVRVSCRAAPEGKKILAIITLKAWGRESRRFLEIQQ